MHCENLPCPVRGGTSNCFVFIAGRDNFVCGLKGRPGDRGLQCTTSRESRLPRTSFTGFRITASNTVEADSDCSALRNLVITPVAPCTDWTFG